jgi:hypothetical protein
LDPSAWLRTGFGLPIFGSGIGERKTESGVYDFGSDNRKSKIENLKLIRALTFFRDQG